MACGWGRGRMASPHNGGVEGGVWLVVGELCHHCTANTTPCPQPRPASACETHSPRPIQIVCTQQPQVLRRPRDMSPRGRASARGGEKDSATNFK
jgi:hypothetical protein